VGTAVETLRSGLEGSVPECPYITEARERSGFLTSLRLDPKSIETGVPVATITSFVLASGVELEDIYAVVIPARTLKHRRSRKQPLSPDESDRLARFVREPQPDGRAIHSLKVRSHP
jgi:hypothetical protein